MKRIAGLLMMVSLMSRANADCELLYAPPEVRAAALKFHHQISQRREPPRQMDMREHSLKATRRYEKTRSP
ncbi:hypothetical protein [Dyella silvae]|uniref:hypothetical protein n=1 Tax=Dyella silvae TaxID=2994424 RepID=UPI00226426ED|nr:hypothetical protein [Dyella silvae]